MTDDFLFLTTRKAAKYLSCSRYELIAWVKPDRRMPGPVGPGSGERRWSKQILDRAKSHVEAWRARARAEGAQRAAVMRARDEAARARRKGMRKAKALTSGKVCATLGCSLTELNRWAGDGRFPPDGEIFIAGLPKKVNARAWLPTTVEAARTRIGGWPIQDATAKSFRRRGLRSVG
jgi:hypothetical protein